MKFLSYAEVDLKAIQHNFRNIQRFAQKDILAVIKADAYGHGMVKVAKALSRSGVAFLGVSDLKEGMLLRKAGIKKPILLLESTLPVQAKSIVEYRLTPTLCSLDMALSLNRYAKGQKKKFPVHVKVDTGMRRLGACYKEAEELISNVQKCPYLWLQGLYTHFPVADSHQNFTKKQIRAFSDLINKLQRHGFNIPYCHAANSAGLLRYKDPLCNLVRPGLLLYGLYPQAGLKSKMSLKHALSIKSKVIFLKKIHKGEGVSYGHTFVAPRNMTIATLPIGYNDGYWRCLSNQGFVLIQGKRCRVLGNVTMDQTLVDVSRIKNVKIGEEAVILGAQKKAFISAEDLAQQAKTINYEVVCSLGNRLPRLYKN